MNINFERGLDPKEAMGIGEKSKISKWLEEMEIEKGEYKIDEQNNQFIINVRSGNVDLLIDIQNNFPNGLPDYIKFSRVSGSFHCTNNKLTSLKGVPFEVGGNFYCQNNPGMFTEEDVRAVCNVIGRVIV